MGLTWLMAWLYAIFLVLYRFQQHAWPNVISFQVGPLIISGSGSLKQALEEVRTTAPVVTPPPPVVTPPPPVNCPPPPVVTPPITCPTCPAAAPCNCQGVAQAQAKVLQKKYQSNPVYVTGPQGHAKVILPIIQPITLPTGFHAGRLHFPPSS